MTMEDTLHIEEEVHQLKEGYREAVVFDGAMYPTPGWTAAWPITSYSQSCEGRPGAQHATSVRRLCRPNVHACAATCM